MFETPESVLYAILAVILVENLFEIYLSTRQCKVYRTALTVPAALKDKITEETFHKARVYGLDKERFGILQHFVFSIVVTSLEIFFGLYAKFWALSVGWTAKVGLHPDNEIYVSCVFMLTLIMYGLVKEIPIAVYKIFVLEERHGFNKQTPGFFVKDQLKGLLVSTTLSLPITSAVIAIVQRGGDYFFLWLWAFVSVVSLLFMTIYPSVIAPLFDTYRPLDDGELRTNIEKLAASLRFPLKKLFVVEGSKRSSHSNAYFYGLFNSKRIVLFDTLLLNKGVEDPSTLPEEERGKGCTNEEVVAVLGHELGHWSLGHVTKNIVIIQVHLLLVFYIFGVLFRNPLLYQALAFPDGVQPVLIGLVVVFTYVLAPYNALLGYAMTIMTRRFEYQADEFAQKLGFAEELGQALVKLNVDNLGFPVHDPLYSSWNHSHPTLLQRLGRLEENKKKYK